MTRLNRNLIVVSAGFLMMITGRWGNAQYVVTLNTAPLAGDPGNGPYTVDFQLNGTAGNSATLGNFNFGGGSAVAGTASTTGTAAGDLLGTVTLDDTTTSFNDFNQQFIPGGELQFTLDTTNIPGGSPPDAFFYTIYDGNFNNIADTGAFLTITYGNPPTIDAEPSSSYGIGAPTVPEPASFAILLPAALFVLSRRRAFALEK